MGLLKLYNVAQDKKLVVAANQTEELQTLSFLSSGDQQTIEFTLLEHGDGDIYLNPWSKISVGSYTLAIGLFITADETQLAYQNDWDSDAVNNKYTGVLALDTEAITTALTSVDSVACTLEIQVTDTAGCTVTTLKKAVTLKKELITAGTLTVPPSETAATQNWVKSIAMLKVNEDDDVIAIQTANYIVEISPATDGSVSITSFPR